MLGVMFNEKGFNLFTALVAAVLIMASFVLIQTMVTTENNIKTQVYDLKKNFGLSDAANIARADAIQNFNYYFREGFENYLSWSESKNNSINVFRINADGSTNFDDWNSVERAFEEALFNVSAPSNQDEPLKSVINYVSEKMINKFEESTYGSYSIKLIHQNNNTMDAEKAIEIATTNAIKRQRESREKFLEVVQCNDNDCPIGTFYLNIPLSKISDEDYEALPRISVKNTVTGEETKIAILPRADLKVYIPLRFFKALFEARKAARLIKQNYNDIDSMKAGFCSNGCFPNTDVRTLVDPNWNKECNGEYRNKIKINISPQPYDFTYKPAELNNLQELLQAKAIEKICENVNTGNYDTGDSSFINEDVHGDATKQGLAAGKPLTLAVYPCPFRIITISSRYEKTKEFKENGCNVGGGRNLFCREIESISAEVVLQETNTLYTVKGNLIKYNIQVKAEFRTNLQSGNDKCYNKSNVCESCDY